MQARCSGHVQDHHSTLTLEHDTLTDEAQPFTTHLPGLIHMLLSA
jgi:hypothetical protein